MYFHAVDALHLPSGEVVNDQTMQAACRALGVATWRKQRNSPSPLIACPLHQRRKFDHQKHRLSRKRKNTSSRTVAERGGPKSVSELQREIACSTGTQKGTKKRVVQNECWSLWQRHWNDVSLSCEKKKTSVQPRILRKYRTSSENRGRTVSSDEAEHRKDMSHATPSNALWSWAVRLFCSTCLCADGL